ncbi:MAG TPA: glycerol-3-phosphate dehydrogenase/oxidase [Ginsengibacter sp.]
MNREDTIAKIKSTDRWDVVVIGGGASGLGIAVESASRGYATLLVEQSDFAKSTSSKSTKLVHGGVRYLAQGNISLVREASIERGLLTKNAPHLVKNQTFIIPVYNWWSRLKYTMGLKLYDWISGRLSLGSSVFISRKSVLEKLPGIISKNLFGGVLYHDGQFDDARLAINLAQTVFDNGGYAINYVKVTELIKEEGRMGGVKAFDTESNEEFSIKSKAVINATGVFVDTILQMDQPGAKQNIAVSQGIHLVLDKKFFPGNDAMMIPETSDGRVLFIVPWHNKLLMGTTDTPVKNISLEPVALETEIQFVLQTANKYLTVTPTRKDVLSVFAGLRPLAAAQDGAGDTKEISRSHKILVSPSALFSIIGGKWTTYRKMGEDMMDKVEKELKWEHVLSTTASLHIHGYTIESDQADPLYYYGNDETFIKRIIDETGNDWISEKLQINKAQAIWAIQHEMARTVEDFLSRRTRALLLDARESIRAAPLVARVMAKEMNKDESWVNDQIEFFKSVAKNYVLEN